jgi:cyclophilin family peptidyl-prolyl cis-trans isomerase/HEAT repeat protein
MAEALRAEDRRLMEPAVKAAMLHDDPKPRARGVRALGRMRLAGQRSLLEARLLEDSAAVVRAEAARALALLGDRASFTPLTQAAEDADPLVRASVLEALGWVASQAGSEAVRTGLSDPDPTVVRAAALAVWRLPDGLEAVDALAAAARRGNTEVKRAAAYALARMAASGLGPPVSGSSPPTPSDDQRAALRDALLNLAAEPDPEIRMQVARGLAQPRRPSEMKVLERLAADSDARVRVHAARALVGEGITLGPGFGRLLRDGDLLVTQAALESLGRVRTPEARERLLEAMGEGPGWLTAVALDTLAGFDAAAGAEAASTRVQATDPRVRAAAARALGKAIPDDLLADPDVTVRSAAVGALAAADPYDARLAPFVSGGDEILRASIAEALGAKMEGQDHSRALAALDNLWRNSASDRVPDCRDAVLDAAGKAGEDPAARALLVEGLTDRAWLVRRRAAEVLKRVFGEDHDAAVGAASERSIEHYAAALRWTAEPHQAIFQLEDGSFTVRLDCEQAPLTCVNFACLANARFYDGHRIHRVVPNFVIQDGDPRGDGSGGPGYAIRDEVGMPFGPGVLGMASAGYDTPGSQWFVTSSAQPHLDLRYTAFGTVIEGFEVVPRVMVGEPVRAIRVDGGATAAPCAPDPRSP